MSSPSHFAVVESHAGGCRVFGLVEKRLYRFLVPWEEVLEAASADADLAAALVRVGLLSEYEGYLAQVDAYLEKLKRDDDRNLVLYFCVTSECGLACPYCFQNHTERRSASPSLVERFLELLERRLAYGPPVPLLYLVLFGGEPIRRPDLCLRLLNGVTRACARHGVRLTAHLAANGILETEEALDPLVAAGLSGIQVTFDGPRAVHEKTRGPNYDTTLNRLPGYAARLSLGIKYNLTRESAKRDHIVDFLDDLARAGVPRDTRVVPEAVAPTLTFNDKSVIYGRGSPELPPAFLRFYRLAAQRGFRPSLSSAFQPPCFLRRRNVVEITPEGQITMCENAPGMAAFDVGSLATLETLTPEKPRVIRAIRDAAAGLCQARRCPFFPLCESGCFLEKRLRGLHFTASCCHDGYFRSFFPGLFDLLAGDDQPLRGMEGA